MKPIKFTKEQYEGFARFIDTIAASAFIGGVVGAAGHSLLRVSEIITLFVICPLLLAASAYIRRPR
jgi:hypothetical protein